MFVAKAAKAAVSAAPRPVLFGPRRVSFPSPLLSQLEPAHTQTSQNLDPQKLDFDSLRENLLENGYIYMPGLLDRDAVVTAKNVILDRMATLNAPLVLDKGRSRLHSLAHLSDDESLEESVGVLAERCGVHCVPFMEGKNAWTDHPAVRAGVLESTVLTSFFRGLFGGEEPLTFDYKWLRGVPGGQFTGAHVDRVYMGRRAVHVLDSVEMGSLAMLHGSHKRKKKDYADDTILQRTYAELDVEQTGLDGTGWLTEDPAEALLLASRMMESKETSLTLEDGTENEFEMQWRTADFQAGDVLIFGQRTMHMSTTNDTDQVRISCDVRWQAQGDAFDSRYVGSHVGEAKPKAGLYAIDGSDEIAESKEKKVTIGELREEWGLTICPTEAQDIDVIWGEKIQV